jgi:ribosomal protein L7Ae-like RNA K-turn-binding protein
MKRDDVQLLLVAKNAGESTHKKFVSNAERKEIPYVIAMEAESLGRLMGRDRVAVLGLTGDLARKIEVDVAHLETLNAFEG